MVNVSIPLAQPRRGGDHRAGIDAAREERAQRHVGDQPRRGRVLQAAAELGHRLGLRDRPGRGRGPPVTARRRHPSAAPQQQRVARRQPVDVAIDRAGVGHVAIGEEILHRLRRQTPRQFRHRSQRRHLGAEHEPPVVQHGVIERLLAQPVARQEQFPPRAVPQREGEHAVELGQAVRPPLLPGMDDRLGVAMRAEHVPGGFQPRAQGLEIVDHAVEDDRNGAVLVVHRLLPGAWIDDRQPAVAERHPWFLMEAVTIRPAMRNRRSHPPQQSTIHRPLSGQIEDTRDSAHARPRGGWCGGFRGADAKARGALPPWTPQQGTLSLASLGVASPGSRGGCGA